MRAVKCDQSEPRVKMQTMGTLRKGVEWIKKSRIVKQCDFGSCVVLCANENDFIAKFVTLR
jgi:hypothetical protein